MTRIARLVIASLLLASMTAVPGEAPPSASAAAFARPGGSPPPSQITRLPFEGQFNITQGPQESNCNNPNLSHYPGYPFAPHMNERAIDFQRSLQGGEAVLAAGDGVVTTSGVLGGPVTVIINHGDVSTVYAHLRQDSWLPAVGARLRAGQRIGTVGTTGATAYHLHFAAFDAGNQALDITGLAGLRWDASLSWTTNWRIRCNGLNVEGIGVGTSGGQPPLDPPAPACDLTLQVTAGLSFDPPTAGPGQSVVASFTVRNTGCATFRPRLIGVAGRGPGGDADIRDFPLVGGVTIGPGAEYRYSEALTLDRVGQYGFGMYYVDETGKGQNFDRFGNGQTTGRTYQVDCVAVPQVTAGLTLDPPTAIPGDTVTATYTIRNTGCAAFRPNLIGVGGRGPGGDPDVQDFPLLSGVVIEPGAEYTYRQSRTLLATGPHAFFMYFQDAAGEGQGFERYSTGQTISLTYEVSCALRLTLEQPLSLDRTTAAAGDPVTATYAFRNTGCAAFAPDYLGVGGRGPGGAEDIRDFPFETGVVVEPGARYSVTVTGSFPVVGDYGFYTSAHSEATGWINIRNGEMTWSATLSITTAPTATAGPTTAVRATATATATAPDTGPTTTDPTATTAPAATATDPPSLFATATPVATGKPTSTPNARGEATLRPTTRPRTTPSGQMPTAQAVRGEPTPRPTTRPRITVTSGTGGDQTGPVQLFATATSAPSGAQPSPEEAVTVAGFATATPAAADARAPTPRPSPRVRDRGGATSTTTAMPSTDAATVAEAPDVPAEPTLPEASDAPRIVAAGGATEQPVSGNEVPGSSRPSPSGSQMGERSDSQASPPDAGPSAVGTTAIDREATLPAEPVPLAATVRDSTGRDVTWVVTGGGPVADWRAAVDPATGMAWLEIDLGTDATVDRVEIVWSTDVPAQTGLLLVSSDGRSWQPSAPIAAPDMAPGRTASIPVAGTTRWLRIELTSTLPAGSVESVETEVQADPGTVPDGAIDPLEPDASSEPGDIVPASEAIDVTEPAEAAPVEVGGIVELTVVGVRDDDRAVVASAPRRG